MAELMRRYVVMTMATEAPFDPNDPEGVFVLKPWKDPAALRALAAYREHCYPELARDLEAWMQVILAGPVVRGDVGRRNEPHVKTVARRDGAAGAETRRRAPAKAKSARPARAATTRRGARPAAKKTKTKRKKRAR